VAWAAALARPAGRVKVPVTVRDKRQQTDLLRGRDQVQGADKVLVLADNARAVAE